MSNRRPRPWCRFSLPCTALAAVLWCIPACAATWIEQAEADLACTGLADAAERAQLEAPFIPDARNAKAVENHFRAAPTNKRHARFRHLTILAAIAWWADRINDQRLRADIYLAIASLSEHYLTEGDDILFRQVAHCARVHLISASLELDLPRAADRFASDLVRAYHEQPPVLSVDDWPLLFALREIRLNPVSRYGIAQLVNHAMVFANSTLQANQAVRASRLLAAASQGMLALGRHEVAKKLAVQSVVVTGKPPAASAVWRAFPTLYDSIEVLTGMDDAAKLRALITDKLPPPGFRDRETVFEVLLRLSKIAVGKTEFAEWGRLQVEASNRLSNQQDLDRSSTTFYRSAHNQLAAERGPDLGPIARRDPKFAAEEYSTYIDLYNTYVKQAQAQYVAYAREQLFFQRKIDMSLNSLVELYPAMPHNQVNIADVTFRLAQLRSFGRLTLATLAGELGRTNIDPESRFNVERFFTLSTQTAVWLYKLFEAVASADGSQAPGGDSLWKVFFTLDVFFNETSKEFERYVAFVRQKAPAVAELVTPRPLPVAKFQQLLQGDEAIVATLVTPLDLYIWAITRNGVALSRSRISDRELGLKIKRLRGSLAPGSGRGTAGPPPFDAAAAYELYRLVFEPIAATLKGVNHIIWFGHGPLGSVPPGVLVTAPPPRAKLSTPEEFSGTNFLVERYAFSALADLSLLPWHRRSERSPSHKKSFLGVGAPLLTMNEISESAPRSRSYELAGGLNGEELSQMPKLKESVDELKGLAAVLGVQGSTLWLGPDASERHFVSDGISGYQVIALATHGFLPGEIRNVPEPALMLALSSDSRDRFDGILTSQEIANLTLDADLVILSACNTASADGRPRAETFTGLTQAFFTAGAKSLMVSHWPVMSGAAVQLSVGTVERAHNEGLPLAQSLQLAIQAVRKQGASNAIEAHPSYWGPFVIVGDGRRSLRR